MEGINTKKKVRRESYGGSELYYRVMHKIFIPQLKLFFKEILNEKIPIILHCSGGQDRTGFVVAVMLKLFNVSNDLIYEFSISGDSETETEIEYIDNDEEREWLENHIEQNLSQILDYPSTE